MIAVLEDPTVNWVPFCGCYSMLDRHGYYVYREVCTEHRASKKLDPAVCALCHTPFLIPRSVPIKQITAEHNKHCLGVCYRRYYDEYCPYDNYSGRR